MELHELRKMVYFSDEEKWVFTDDECDAPCEGTYCVAVWWNTYPMEWRCGYINSEDCDAIGLFIASGKNPQEAITHTWEKIQADEPYQKREAKDEIRV
jgi:hypothetical protein